MRTGRPPRSSPQQRSRRPRSGSGVGRIETTVRRSVSTHIWNATNELADVLAAAALNRTVP